MNQAALDAFDTLYALNFCDRALLQQAFVHRSFVNEQTPGTVWLKDNERLEFLGDVVLSFVVSEYLYKNYPDDQEGVLTHLRTVVVRRETLAHFAQAMSIGDLLLVGVGEEDSGGRARLATLCAAFEALVGALFLDQGVDKVREFLLTRVKEVLAPIKPQSTPKDPKSRFQEWAQRMINFTPRYKIVEATGPDHARQFVSVVSVKGDQFGIGFGNSKQDAGQAAAASALYRVGESAPEYVPNPEIEAHYELTGMHTPSERAAESAPV